MRCVGSCGSAMVLALCLLASSASRAQDKPAAYDWTGFYAGINAGAANGSYAPTTSTVKSPTYLFKQVDVNAVNAAGMLDMKPKGFLGGIQGGYNRQFGPVVLGLEAGLDYLHLNGEGNSGAVRYPGGGSGFYAGAALNQFVISSYTNADWLFTLHPRIGIAADNWLFYATGGLALTHLQGEFLFTDFNAIKGTEGAEQAAAVKSLRAGYIVGGGVETAVTDHLRLKAEYAYVNFSTVHAHEMENDFQTAFIPPATQTFTQTMKLSTQFVRVGVNYSFGNSVGPTPGAPSWMANLFARADDGKSDWQFEVGARTWFSSGNVGASAPLLDTTPPPSNLISRLTYEGADAWSGETFARLDHASGFFVKGNLGAGGITDGNLVDEDFPADKSYSNTNSLLSGGHLGYATVDLGYSFLRAPGAKVGAFVGYNYLAQHLNSYDCTQQAGDDSCVGPPDPNFLGISEDERFYSLRVGLSAQFMLTDRFKFSADAAYLPAVHFRALDNHNFREGSFPSLSNNGDGVMLEGMLDYAVTPNWNVGVGGRFWAWNMHDGYAYFDFLGLPPGTTPAYIRFYNERHGIFVQSSYRWGDTTPTFASNGETPPPMDWRGFYLGGHLGGAWTDDHWSDPFGETMRAGLPNVPGFGDTIHGTGPLAGPQAGFNWQFGHVVAGVEADWSAADLRGENTCFSGLGGLNCQHIIRSIVSGGGRLGYAWDRALLYGKGGAAGAAIEYDLLGNTGGNSRGYDSTRKSAWGWDAGGGVEYALTDHWTAMCEYDHVDLGNIAVPFPTVAQVKNQQIRVRQTIDMFKLGVNYKFGWMPAKAEQN